MSFANRLMELRKKAGLTQAQLGEKAGIGQRTISHLEQGRNQPTWKVVLELSKALGVSTEAFAIAEEEPKVKKRKRGRPKKEEK